MLSSSLKRYARYSATFHVPKCPSSLPSAKSCRRYTYEIVFVGRGVIGNVQTLTADTSSCAGFAVSGGGNSGIDIDTLNEGEALGTSTTVQSVKVTRESFDEMNLL